MSDSSPAGRTPERKPAATPSRHNWEVSLKIGIRPGNGKDEMQVSSKGGTEMTERANGDWPTTVGTGFRKKTRPAQIQPNPYYNAPTPTIRLGSYTFVLILLVACVWWAPAPRSLAQEAPFSSTQEYRDLLANLGEKVVRPSRMSAGDLWKSTLPDVPVVEEQTTAAITLEGVLWRLEMNKNPWQLSFVNKATRAIWKLGAPNAPGSSGIWWSKNATGSATKLRVSSVESVQRSGNHWTMVCRLGGTDQQATLGLDIISPAMIRLSIEGPSWDSDAQLGVGVAAQGPFYGLGERFEKAKLDGLKVTLHPEDNWDTSITPGHNWTYAPVPFLLSPHGFGLYIDTARISTFDLTKVESQGFSAEINGPSSDLYFIVADSPKGVISAYTGLTGRTPLSPPWAFGVWVCALKGRNGVLATARRLRQEGIPASALWVYDLPDIAGNMVAPHGE